MICGDTSHSVIEILGWCQMIEDKKTAPVIGHCDIKKLVQLITYNVITIKRTVVLLSAPSGPELV